MQQVRIGYGQFGDVYRIIERGVSADYVIKRFQRNESYEKERDVIMQFRKEAKGNLELKKLLDEYTLIMLNDDPFEKDGEIRYLNCFGTTLKQYMTKMPVFFNIQQKSTTRTLLLPIAVATMTTCLTLLAGFEKHQCANRYHNDLHLGNLMLCLRDKLENVRIVDFGRADTHYRRFYYSASGSDKLKKSKTLEEITWYLPPYDNWPSIFENVTNKNKSVRTGYDDFMENGDDNLYDNLDNPALQPFYVKQELFDVGLIICQIYVAYFYSENDPFSTFTLELLTGKYNTMQAALSQWNSIKDSIIQKGGKPCRDSVRISGETKPRKIYTKSGVKVVRLNGAYVSLKSLKGRYRYVAQQ